MRRRSAPLFAVGAHDLREEVSSLGSSAVVEGSGRGLAALPFWIQALSTRQMDKALQHRSPSLMRCEEHLARTLAQRMGAQSSAARALTELDQRRAKGEQVCIFPFRGEWLVGPA